MNGSVRDDGVNKMEEGKGSVIFMWGYLPGASPHRSPLLFPVTVRFPVENLAGDSWKSICAGGCGFAMAISESGKLITWGSADDQGQSFLTSGKHVETPEPFLLPAEAATMKAAAGWAHCVSITDTGEVYTWGWKECVPSGKAVHDFADGRSFGEDDSVEQSSLLTKQVSPPSQVPKSTGGTVPHPENRKAEEESIKRRKISSSKQQLESSISADETLSAPPCLVALDPGVRITSVAAGGRHTLALSGKSTTSWVLQPTNHRFQVWGWGYGGEGQLGFGSRTKMVCSPHLIPCIEPSSYGKDRSSVVHQGSMSSATLAPKVPGSYIKGIACGGRHSAVITDAGALLSFGWGLHGQCGQGNTNDVLSPTCVSSLLGSQIEGIAAGLWHTLCISVEGRVHAFGGNQFGLLGLGTDADEVETLPRILDAPLFGSKNAKIVSCGARHSAILTDKGTGFLSERSHIDWSAEFLHYSEDSKVYCWGWNKYGQLGLGDTIDRNVPSQVPIDDCLVKTISCGWWHTLLLAETTI